MTLVFEKFEKMMKGLAFDRGMSATPKVFGVVRHKREISSKPRLIHKGCSMLTARGPGSMLYESEVFEVIRNKDYWRAINMFNDHRARCTPSKKLKAAIDAARKEHARV